MNYRVINENEPYLEYHGIKGQKWGVRRYQNENGTLTDAGKKRAAKNIKRYGKGNAELAYIKMNKKSEKKAKLAKNTVQTIGATGAILGSITNLNAVTGTVLGTAAAPTIVAASWALPLGAAGIAGGYAAKRFVSKMYDQKASEVLQYARTNMSK